MAADYNFLTVPQVEFYEENGYLVVENLFGADECQKLINRMEQLLDGFTPENKSIFSTNKQAQIVNEYFAKSASNISFFFEEKAFDDDGELKQPKELSINKVGHALHDLDPAFREFSRSDKMVGLVASLGYRKPLPVQSMYIFKQPGIGGEVRPHQDSTFLYTSPHTTTGFWIALEDANIHNGCLWALPGSHTSVPTRKFMRTDDGGVTFEGTDPTYELSKFVPLEMKAGSLVVLHGHLVHHSYENTSSKSRHAYSVHVVEGDDTVYPKENWLQRDSSLPFEPLYTCRKTGRQ